MTKNDDDKPDKELTATAGGEELSPEEFFDNTGLKRGTNTLEMQDDNMYIILTKEALPDGATENMNSVGMTLLSSNGGDPDLVVLAAGMCELLRHDPEILIQAGYEFMDKAANFGDGVNTLQ